MKVESWKMKNPKKSKNPKNPKNLQLADKGES